MVSFTSIRRSNGDDDKRLLIKSVYEYSVEESTVEKFDSIVGIKFPVSSFYDAVVGARIDAPNGEDQYHGYFGMQGLAEQFIHMGGGISVSEHPSVKFGAEYEGLITNWIRRCRRRFALLPPKIFQALVIL